MKYVFLLASCFVFLMFPINGAENKNPLTSIMFSQINTLKLQGLYANVYFSVHDGSEVIIEGETIVLPKLEFTESKNILIIKKGRYSRADPIRLHISIPRKCLLDISVSQNSRVAIPQLSAPLKLNLTGKSQASIDGCVGLVLTAKDAAKVSIQQCIGDVSANLWDQSELDIQHAILEKVLMTASGTSHVFVNGSIKSLNLTTRGAAGIKLESVTDTFVWVGRGNDHVSIQKLSGVADVTSGYNSSLVVDDANLKTLLAATAANGKIVIMGVVENAALSARGGSQIVVDTITGKILRNYEMRKGSIKILNP